MQTINKIGEFIDLKDNTWLENQRYAGSIVAKTLHALESIVKNEPPKSLLEYNEIAESIITESNCTATFKNYDHHKLGGPKFPAGVCISINDQLVHSVPTKYIPKDGDIITFDLGATYKGAIGDAARTMIIGEPKEPEHIELIQVTKECLQKAIDAIEIGKRIGVIGEAIYSHARSKGYSVISDFGGHGLTYSKIDSNNNIIKNGAHAEPFISNRSTLNEGIRIEPGLTIAIEPLLSLGSSKTYVGSDQWTVYMQDGSMCAHEEHTIFIHEDGTKEIITERK